MSSATLPSPSPQGPCFGPLGTRLAHKSNVNWNAAQLMKFDLNWFKLLPAIYTHLLIHYAIHALIHSFTWLINSIERRLPRHNLIPAQISTAWPRPAWPRHRAGQTNRPIEWAAYPFERLPFMQRLCRHFPLYVIRVICSAAKYVACGMGHAATEATSGVD